MAVAAVEAAPDRAKRRRRKSGTIRRTWRLAHLILALVAGLPLAVVGGTGAILAFAPELQRLVQPQFYAVEAAGAPLQVGELVRRLRLEQPTTRLNHVMRFGEVERPWIGWVSEGEGAAERGFLIHIDPFTGRVSTDTTDGGWLGWTERLHTSLAAGPVGREVVAYSSLVAIVLAITGLYLWWPLRRSTLRQARRGHLLAWHNLVGLIFFPVLLLMALTGIEQSWGPIVAPILDAATGAEAPAPQPPSTPAPGAQVFPLHRAVEDVGRRFPGAVVTAFSDPLRPTSSYMIAFGYPGELNRFGWEKVFVDRYSGEVLDHVDAYEHSLGERWRRAGWQFHGGDSFGTYGRVVWAVASAMLGVLIGTGVIVWWRRRRRLPGRLRHRTRPNTPVRAASKI